MPDRPESDLRRPGRRRVNQPLVERANPRLVDSDDFIHDNLLPYPTPHPRIGSASRRAATLGTLSRVRRSPGQEAIMKIELLMVLVMLSGLLGALVFWLS